MKWTRSQRDDYQWHEWFAWFPVEVSTDHVDGKYIYHRVWLEPVWRRRVTFWDLSYWEYWSKEIRLPDTDSRREHGTIAQTCRASTL